MSDTTTPERKAVIKGHDAARSVPSYLPRGYRVVEERSPNEVVIAGRDDSGWTLDDYVLPRLASGLFFGEEIKP